MKWKSLNKSEADNIMKKWTEKPNGNNDIDYRTIRNHLVNAKDKVMVSLEIQDSQIQSAGYEFDLNFGMQLYRIFSMDNNFNLRNASDDGFWRYLSINVVPDIVYLRHGLTASRFWKEPRRIYLKTLWWYIYLSWQGDYDKTFNVLKNNTTDEIGQLVERSGSSGYRVELYRKIMDHYGKLDAVQRKKRPQIFRRVMKLNTARIKVVEPALLIGGERTYVKELFQYFEQL